MPRIAKEDVPPTPEIFLHVTVGGTDGNPSDLPGEQFLSLIDISQFVAYLTSRREGSLILVVHPYTTLITLTYCQNALINTYSYRLPSRIPYRPCEGLGSGTSRAACAAT